MESEGGSVRASSMQGFSVRGMVAAINKNAALRNSPTGNNMAPSPERPRSAMALSLPDRKEVGASGKFLLGGSLKLQRPFTAPLLPVPGADASVPAMRVFGKLSLFDHGHTILSKCSKASAPECM